MTTDFSVISGTTVPKDYFWDFGKPLETTPTTVVADSRTDYISGYAPAVKVVFKSDIRDPIYGSAPNISATYIWNFGDYYNSINNIAILPCIDSTLEHTYILPGKYNVSLTNIQSKELEPPQTADEQCFGRHGIGWYWDNLDSSRTLTKTTWDETMCVPPVTAVNKRFKWWDDEGRCFQKFCKFWNWRDLSIIGRNPVFWFQTYSFETFFKRWEFEVNEQICEAEPEATLESTEQVALKTAIVEVIELMPVATIFSNTTPLTGQSPFTFSLSPKFCKTGSFPIDRIEWSAGDGSPIKIVTRYSSPDNRFFTFNNTYFDDPQDPRNYDFTYTLIRNNDTYPVFYPSLTCYSACTNSSDSCSIVLGPILLEPQNQDIQILKVKNNNAGEIYGIEINKNMTVLSTTAKNKDITVQISQPSSPVKPNATKQPVIYFGNTGEGFPPEFVPSCEYVPSEYDYLFFETEESGTLFTETTAITLDDGLLLYK